MDGEVKMVKNNEKNCKLNKNKTSIKQYNNFY